MKSSIHALIHACTLFTGISAMGDTIAYWRFEGDGVTVPTAGTQIEDSNGRTATNTGVGIRAVDSSGNGNTIWAWEHAWAGHTYVWESAYGLNPDSSIGINGTTGDLDNDGFTNLQEFKGGSLPNTNTSVPGDVDGDGLLDSWETTSNKTRT